MGVLNAEQWGAQILQEIDEVGLDCVLRDLWTTDADTHEAAAVESNSVRGFGVAPLDRILNIFNPRTKQAARAPRVVELTSVASGAGKTHFLYYLISVTALPASCGGKEACALVLDVDGRFDVQRLAQVMYFVLQQQNDGKEKSSIVNELLGIVKNSLTQVHIFRPQSMTALIATIKYIPTYLRKLTLERRLDLLVLDSATGLFWQDKLSTEESIGAADRSKTGYEEMIQKLRKLQEFFGCNVLATTWGLSPDMKHRVRRPLSFRPLLPPAWQAFCNLRLVVDRKIVNKFHDSLTLENAMRDAPTRQAVIDEGLFYIWVDHWNSDSWVDSTWEELHRGQGQWRFEFIINTDGVKVP